MDLTKKEIIDFLNSPAKELFGIADKVRQENIGNGVYLRGLIEFSNFCKRNCFYCGLRYENTNCERYRLESDEIVNLARNGVELGYKTIVLQSGEDNYYDIEKMCHILSEIKKLDVAITLSIGEKTRQEYEIYKNAGADRFLIRIETTDKDLYHKLHPNMSFENRIKCLETLKSLGYEVGTGCLVGLPNQSIESLADDILFFKQIDSDMIGIGPFIANNQTPLANSANGSLELALKVMSLTRILLPTSNIPATTAMETLHPQGRILALNAGANVVMPNITQGECRKKYALYPNKAGENSTAQDSLYSITKMINSLGRFVDNSKGFRKS